MLGFVPACAKPMPRTGTSVCAKKGKKKSGKREPRGKQKYGVPNSDLKNFVTLPSEFASDVEDDLVEENIKTDEIKSKLTPLTGLGAETSTKKKVKKGSEEPEAITVAKQAAWIGIGSLVAIFFYVHLVAVGDWLPAKN